MKINIITFSNLFNQKTIAFILFLVTSVQTTGILLYMTLHGWYVTYQVSKHPQKNKISSTF